MAITETSDSATISTTEYSCPNDGNYNSGNGITTDGMYQFFLDLNAMAAGDQFEIKLYEAAASGGTQRLIETWIVDGAQATPIWVSPMLLLTNAWDFTLKRISGSDRSILWSIRRVDFADAPTASVNADAVFNKVIENSLSFAALIKRLIAFAYGKSSGGGTSSLKFRDLTDTYDRITATVDANGNRTGMSYNDA